MKVHYQNLNSRAHCSKCKKSKALSDFHKDKSRPSGVQRYCKDCKKKVDVHGSTEHVGKFLLYYLPKERYIGMTKNFKKRVIGKSLKNIPDLNLMINPLKLLLVLNMKISFT